MTVLKLSNASSDIAVLRVRGKRIFICWQLHVARAFDCMFSNACMNYNQFP